MSILAISCYFSGRFQSGLEGSYERISVPDRQFDLRSRASDCATRSDADRLQSRAVEPTSILLGEVVSDANGACSDAKLFICSPHSCEVVKTRFFFTLS